MRELKFRAWDGERYWYNIVPSPIPSRTTDICKEITSHEPEYYNMVDIIEGVDAIEQYTGLEDKNDKEIYEGDILKILGYGTYAVFWRTWDVSLSLKAIDTDIEEHKVLMLCEDWESDYEVIGNIHENPELLEGKK